MATPKNDRLAPSADSLPEVQALPAPDASDRQGMESETGIQIGIVKGQIVPGLVGQDEQTPSGRVPPAGPVRSGTAILGRYEDQMQVGTEWERSIAQHQAIALQNAKDRGLVTPGMIEHVTARPGLNPYAVNELHIDIQQGFRKKMLTILFLQMCFSLCVAFFVRYVPAVRGVLEKAFPPQSIPSLVLLVVLMVGLPLMSCVKDKHPWNLLLTAGWSVVLGVFLGASDLPGAYSRAHAFLMIMLELTCAILFLIPFSLLKTVDRLEGQPKLWGFGAAGFCSWAITVLLAAVVFTQVKADVYWDDIAPEPIFATVTVVSTIVFTWFCYEAYKLSCRMKSGTGLNVLDRKSVV